MTEFFTEIFMKILIAALLTVVSITVFASDPESVRGSIKGSLNGELDPVVGEGTMFLYQNLANKKYYVIYTSACELDVDDGQTFSVLGKNLHDVDENQKLRLTHLALYAFNHDNKDLKIEKYYEIYSCDDVDLKKASD